MTKEILQIEFRYRDAPKSEHFSGHETKTVTIGIFDTLPEAMSSGNEALKILATKFEVRADDQFKDKHLFGKYPKTLVTNTCYPTNGIQYFAKIETLKFDKLADAMHETFSAFERYKARQAKNED